MRVADLGEAESLRALDELIERHLLREEASGREAVMLLDPTPTYTSRTRRRQVAYRGRPARRRLLHQRAFEVLEEGVSLLPRSWRGTRLREVSRSRRSGTLLRRGIGRWKCSPQRMQSSTTRGRAPCWPK